MKADLLFRGTEVHDGTGAAAVRADVAVSSGVTTVVTGNCGISLGPSPLTRRAAPVPPLDLPGGAAAFGYETFAGYLAAVEAAGPAVNVARAELTLDLDGQAAHAGGGRVLRRRPMP